MNLNTTSVYALISAALENFDATGGAGLTDEQGEAEVLAALSSNGDLVAVLTTNSILGQVVTYIWQVVKRIQAKIKALIDMLVDKIHELTGKTVQWEVSPGGGMGD